jgi:dTDP-glucose 4,6-dehydratase
MKNVMVTGGAGFIGSNFVRYLLRQEPEVQIYNLDALTYAGSLDNLKDLHDPSRHTFIHGNITNYDIVMNVLKTHHIDTIVHFAAESHVDRSIQNPAAFIETNINGTFNLLRAARQFWLMEDYKSIEGIRFHHISTDEVYGSLAPLDPPFSEVNRYAPNSPYAASKAASDHLVRSYGKTFGLPFTITTCSNNFGPFQFPEKLIPLMILNAIQGKPLPVYGDGLQVRDWLFVEDHCEAILLVLKQGQPGQTYNIGGNNQLTNLEVVKSICSNLDKLLPESQFHPHANLIQMVEDRPGHDRRYAMNTSFIYDQIGWQPRHDFETGLKITLQWYLEHLEWVKVIQSQEIYKKWMEINYQKRYTNNEGKLE